MKSLYALLRERCGLSLREAADFHGVPVDTVTSWSSGRRRAPDGVLAELRGLYERIDAAADELIEMVDKATAEAIIEIGIASDDYEARSIGWPCVGAQAASIGLACAYLDDRSIRIVSRGTTAANAAAADAHDVSIIRNKIQEP